MSQPLSNGQTGAAGAANRLDISGSINPANGDPIVADLLREAASAELTGSFRLEHPSGLKTIIYMRSGRCVFAAGNSRKLKLSEFLIENKLIAPDKLTEISQKISSPQASTLPSSTQITTKNAVSPPQY